MLVPLYGHWIVLADDLRQSPSVIGLIEVRGSDSSEWLQSAAGVRSQMHGLHYRYYMGSLGTASLVLAAWHKRLRIITSTIVRYICHCMQSLPAAQYTRQSVRTASAFLDCGLYVAVCMHESCARSPSQLRLLTAVTPNVED